MECPLEQQQKTELLLAYCAGRLDPSAVPVLERHLENCTACKAYVDAQKKVWEALDSWPATQVSPDFDQRLYRRIQAEDGGGWRARWLGSWLASAPSPVLSLATACAIVLVAFLLQPPGNLTPPVEITAENVDIEQVESVLEDMEMLQQLNLLPPAEVGT
jgi:anti-sigma factor RsiW